MKRNFIAKRFQNAGTGLTLDTAALAKYKDIVDLSIGDTDFITDDAIIDTAFREAKAGYTHYGDPKGDPELIRSVCDACPRFARRGKRTSTRAFRATTCS